MELQAPRTRQVSVQISETLGSLMLMHLDMTAEFNCVRPACVSVQPHFPK